MIKFITSKLLILFIFFLTINHANANDENFNSFTKKFTKIIQRIKNEVKETKEYQIKEWKEAKIKTSNDLKLTKSKLTGFFSKFPKTKPEIPAPIIAIFFFIDIIFLLF